MKREKADVLSSTPSTVLPSKYALIKENQFASIL